VLVLAEKEKIREHENTDTASHNKEQRIDAQVSAAFPLLWQPYTIMYPFQIIPGLPYPRVRVQENRQSAHPLRHRRPTRVHLADTPPLSAR